MTTPTLLVLTAVEAERTAVLRDLPGSPTTHHLGPYDVQTLATGAGAVTFIVGGVGPAAAAAATATALALARFDLCINLGVAGAFRGGGAEVGGIVVATELVAADLGAWAPEGFLDLSAIGLDGAGGIRPPAAVLAAAAERLATAGLPTASGPVLTLSAMTGTDARAAELFDRHAAMAEAMEGAGMAEAAARHHTPVLEVRTISNLVGDRDRETWELGSALAALSAVAAALFAQPLPVQFSAT